MGKGNKIWTVEEIKEKLIHEQEWVERGIVAIHKKQTASEQVNEVTTKRNGVGFTKFDAGFLSSLAKRLEKYGRLTSNQLFHGRKKIIKYSNQLTKIANGEI